MGQGCCVPGCLWGKDAVFQVECGARMLCSRLSVGQGC